MSLPQKKEPIRTRFFNVVEAEMKADSRDRDQLELRPSRNSVKLSSYAPMRKARTILALVDSTESSHKALVPCDSRSKRCCINRSRRRFSL